MKGVIFTFALTYGGAFASLFNPYHGLLVYVMFAVIRPEDLWGFALPQGGYYSRIVGIGLLAGWAIHGFGKWEFGRARLVVTCIICYFAWSAVSAWFAVADTEVAFQQVEAYAKIVLPFLVGITTVRTVRQLKQLAWVILIAQAYLAYEFNMLYLTWPDFDPNDWCFGTADRNGIAISMVTSVGLAGFIGLYSERWWQKLFLLGAAGLMVHVVLFSMSRGGMLALIATGIAAVIIVPKRPAYLLLMAVGLAVALRLAGPSVYERFGTAFASEEQRDYSAESRVELWSACIQVALDHPIFGIGSNNWRQIAHNYGFPRGKDAHTMWLHIAAELGIPGLCFILGFYGCCSGRLWLLARPHMPLADPFYRCVGHGVIASLIGFVVSAQFVSVYGVELPYYITLLGAGALKLSSLGAEDEQDAEPALHDTEVAEPDAIDATYTHESNEVLSA